MTDTAPANRSGTLTVLGWAAFLAASWTWVIGMFLPVLLVRDYGVWGFVAFALPNIVGAAAMGWVIRSPAESAAMVATHRAACRAFSLVTIAFHAFVLTWLMPALLDGGYTFSNSAEALSAIVPLLAGFTVLALYARGVHRTVLAAVVLAVSVLLGGLLFAGGIAQDWSRPALTAPLSSTMDLMWLAPVMIFGFALCPYLDLTFHRARRALDGRSAKLAFGIGFGVFFAAMILITLLYAPTMRGLISAPDALGTAPLAAFIAVPLFAHLVIQSAFTAGVHVDSLVVTTDLRSHNITRLAAVLLGIAIGITGHLAPGLAGLSAGEVLYRCFMSFYGLVFPAYAWLCMIPSSRGPAGPTKAKLRILAFAVGVAAPMYYMGFIQRQEVWLAPGLFIVLLSRLALPKVAVAADRRAA
jgi:hypothetical protein